MRGLACRIVLLWCSASACDNAETKCHFGTDHAVFRSHGVQFDDVALVNGHSGTLAVFSDVSGLYLRSLDDYGLPRAPAERLGERCDAGLDAAVSGKILWLACARRPHHGAGSGVVSLYMRNDSGLVERQRYGPLGPESLGVALAVLPGRAVVAWQDAAMGGAQLWYGTSDSAEPHGLSDPEWFAGSPRLGLAGSRLLALWDESRERGKSYESRVRLLALSGGAQRAHAVTVAQAEDASPSPAIAVDTQGAWLAFRDRRKGQRKTGLYVSRLDTRGRHGDEVRVGRADGVGRPTLSSCLSGLFAATPRTFAGDYFVGVIRIDRDLGTFSLEQQFYEDSHEFSQVASACLRSRMLLLIAERGKLGGGRAALRSVGFSCQ